MLDSVQTLTLQTTATASLSVPAGKTLMLFVAGVSFKVLAGSEDMLDGAAGFPFAADIEHRLPVAGGDYYSFLGDSSGTLVLGLL